MVNLFQCTIKINKAQINEMKNSEKKKGFCIMNLPHLSEVNNFVSASFYPQGGQAFKAGA